MEMTFEEARKKYRPKKISCLFIAEAPPAEDSKRFFYFENVSKGDTLYLETMKALFPGDLVDLNKKQITKKLRAEKIYFLTRFCSNGFYLDDASKTPMPHKPTQSEKRNIIRPELPGLIERLKPHIELKTPIILIASVVHEICYLPLINLDLNILNDFSIPFPIGYQDEYKIGITKCLKKAGLFPSDENL